jgi:hypothetical protein
MPFDAVRQDYGATARTPPCPRRSRAGVRILSITMQVAPSFNRGVACAVLVSFSTKCRGTANLYKTRSELVMESI